MALSPYQERYVLCNGENHLSASVELLTTKRRQTSKINSSRLLHDLCSGLAVRSCQEWSSSSAAVGCHIQRHIQGLLHSLAAPFYERPSGSTQRGYISKVPHFNSISNYLENPELTPILQNFIIQSSLPLKSVETDFAADSSGFTNFADSLAGLTTSTDRCGSKHDWVKAHLMVGTKTNIVTAVEIHGQHANDSPEAPRSGQQHSAELSRLPKSPQTRGMQVRANMEAVTALGAVPFISFARIIRGNGGGTWEKMYHYFQFQATMSSCSTTISVPTSNPRFRMMKRKFGDGLRSKTDVAMVNETLCKILCHNLVVYSPFPLWNSPSK